MMIERDFELGDVCFLPVTGDGTAFTEPPCTGFSRYSSHYIVLDDRVFTMFHLGDHWRGIVVLLDDGRVLCLYGYEHKLGVGRGNSELVG